MALNVSIRAADPFTWSVVEPFIQTLRSAVGTKVGSPQATPETLVQLLETSIDPLSEHGRWQAGIMGTLIADATAWAAAKAAAPGAAANPAYVLTMSDLLNFYIDKLHTRFQPQRIPALENQLIDAVQGQDEPASAFFSRMESLLAQVPHMGTKDQLIDSFIHKLRNPAVRSHILTKLSTFPRSQWAAQIESVVKTADNVGYFSSSSNPLARSLVQTLSAPMASAQPLTTSIPDQRPVACTTTAAGHSGDTESVCDEEPKQGAFCLWHGWGSHASNDCPRIIEIVERDRAVHASPYGNPRFLPPEPYAAPQAFSTYAAPPVAPYSYQSYASSGHQYNPPYAPGAAAPTPSSYAPPFGYSTHSYASSSHVPHSSHSVYAPSSAAPYSDRPDAFPHHYNGWRCNTCGGRHSVARCYIEHPELAPPGWEPQGSLARALWAKLKLQ